jgi:signal recognition particle GTPase
MMASIDSTTCNTTMCDSTTNEKSQTCIVILMGLPGAGKTTFCQKFVSEFSKLDFNVIHVCYDAFVDLQEQAKLAENNDEGGSTKWKEKRKEISDGVESFLDFLKDETSERKLSHVCQELIKTYQSFR